MDKRIESSLVLTHSPLCKINPLDNTIMKLMEIIIMANNGIRTLYSLNWIAIGTGIDVVVAFTFTSKFCVVTAVLKVYRKLI